MILGLLSAAALATATPQPASAPTDPDATRARIDHILDKTYPALDAIYKDLHAHPELAFQETRSSRILAGHMRKLGFTVTEGVGGTGIVATLSNGSGPVVLVRTDMDALPLEEKTGLPYASHVQATLDGKLTPVAHACGHDAHMTWWLGAAEVLVAMKDNWHGTLVFVGQPAEETLSGARAMLADGLYSRFPKPDYAFGAHVGGGMPAGTIVIKEGDLLSASDALAITFHGRGGHGSMPENTIDPVVMGARFVNDVQTVISRRKAPGAFGVITVGAFNAGTVGNVIPDEANLKLSLRSFTPEVRALLLDGVTRTAKAVSTGAGAAEPTITKLYGAATTRNDVALAEKLAPMLRTAFGKGVVVIPASVPGFPGSEDFSEFALAGTPSLYFMIGGQTPEQLAEYKQTGLPAPSNHSPYYAPAPEPAIRTGAAVLATAVLGVAGVQRIH